MDRLAALARPAGELAPQLTQDGVTGVDLGGVEHRAQAAGASAHLTV